MYYTTAGLKAGSFCYTGISRGNLKKLPLLKTLYHVAQ